VWRRADGGALGPVESWRRRGGVGTRGLGWRDGIRDAGRLVPQLKAPRTGAGASVAASRGRRRGPLRAAGGGATRRGLRDVVVAACWRRGRVTERRAGWTPGGRAGGGAAGGRVAARRAGVAAKCELCVWWMAVGTA